jgi:SAM-dependent methyltransferase
MNAPEAQIAGIEEVDLVGDASRLHELVRGKGMVNQFDWIVSSHNFEHLPDPIRFLSDCESLLKPGGFVGMIIPDKRHCFDRFRAITSIADLVRAHLDSTSPTAAAFAMFAQQALKTTLILPGGTERRSWPTDINQPEYLRTQDIRAKYEMLKKWLSLDPVPEFIGHRWQFSPAAFELALLDLRATGLTHFALEEIVPTEGGQEFAVRLRSGTAIEMCPEDYTNRRSELCRRIEDEAAAVTGHCQRLENELAATRAELDKAQAQIARLNDSPANE